MEERIFAFDFLRDSITAYYHLSIPSRVDGRNRGIRVGRETPVRIVGHWKFRHPPSILKNPGRGGGGGGVNETRRGGNAEDD